MILKTLPQKLPLFLFLFCTFAFPQAVVGQKLSADETWVRFPDKEIALSEGFMQIERQTPFRFTFAGGRPDVSKRVAMPEGRYTVAEAVSRLFENTGYTYVLRQGYFVVAPAARRTVSRSAASPVTTGGIIRNEHELRRFAADEQRGEDSVFRRTVELTEPFRFNGDDDYTFYTPGSGPNGRNVPSVFETAPRWQRSKFALKTNLLYGTIALAPNLRAEFGLGNRTTLEAGLSYNGWNLNGSMGDNRKMVHGTALTEFRYWFCERFYGHFLGAHAFGAFYNVGGHDIPLLFEKQFRYEGWAVGAGVSYGYLWMLSPRWGLEFNVGLGAAYLKYGKWGCDKCDDKIGDFDKVYFGPTRLGITLEFIIK